MHTFPKYLSNIFANNIFLPNNSPTRGLGAKAATQMEPPQIQQRQYICHAPAYICQI